MLFSRSRFTGKERDTESGNDYFGARYYASSMGRFMSPDWSSTPEDMPYAKLTNPQSLNLYSYMYNNPIIGADPTGHLPDLWEGWGAPPSALQSAIGAAATDAKKKSTNNPAPPPPAQQQNSPHPYVTPTGPGTEIGNIIDNAHPSNPGPIGKGECVNACRHFATGLPDHTQWTQGVPVVITVDGKLTINPAVKPGTAVATFVDGHYPGDADPHKNSGIFLGPGNWGPVGSMQLVDQWPGSPGPRSRPVFPNGGFGPEDRSNHSTAYYVIMAP